MSVSDEFRARFAGLSEQRTAVEGLREALPWLSGSSAIATTLLATGLLWSAAVAMNPEHHSPVPLPVVLGVTGLNLLAAVVLGSAGWWVEKVVDERTVALEREARALRALHRRLAGL